MSSRPYPCVHWFPSLYTIQNLEKFPKLPLRFNETLVDIFARISFIELDDGKIGTGNPDI